MTAIQLEKVSFAYRKNDLVLRDVNLTVPKGSIYGFLGANGAGKTTTLRIILGLLKVNNGSVSVLAQNIKQGFPEALGKVGSMIENASLYGHLSASENLKIWHRYFNIKDKNRIAEVLDIVGLSTVGKKKSEDFSTGMKQRLGLATALLQNPEIIILDEPTNGLDPMGIIDLRNLLNRLKEEGKTILLSSHILPEVEKLVTHIGIIKDGSIVFEGSIDELKEVKNKNIIVRIKVDQHEKAMELLKEEFEPIMEGDELIIKARHQSLLPKALKTLVEQDIDVFQFSPESKDLENLFLSIAKNQ